MVVTHELMTMTKPKEAICTNPNSQSWAFEIILMNEVCGWLLSGGFGAKNNTVKQITAAKVAVSKNVEVFIVG